MYVHVVLCCVLCYEFGHWIAYCIAYCPSVDYYCLLAPGVERLLVSIKYYMLMSTLMLKRLVHILIVAVVCILISVSCFCCILFFASCLHFVFYILMFVSCMCCGLYLDLQHFFASCDFVSWFCQAHILIVAVVCILISVSCFFQLSCFLHLVCIFFFCILMFVSCMCCDLYLD